MPSKLNVLVVVAVSVCCALTTLANANSLTIRDQFPTRGEATSIILQDADGLPVVGALVEAVYRPGSSVSQHANLGTTGTGGSLGWTPTEAGLVTLTATWGEGTAAKSASLNVSVRFDSVPKMGLIIMVLAGLVLVGGSAVRMRRIMNG